MKNYTIKDECEEIFRVLVAKHACLQLASLKFDQWSNEDACEIVADLIKAIEYSTYIRREHFLNDWGK